MSQYGAETYLNATYEGPAYTWVCRPLRSQLPATYYFVQTSSSEMSFTNYRVEEMAPSMNPNRWEQVASCQGSPQNTPVLYQSQALSFSTALDAAAECPSPSSPTLVVLDDHFHSTSENSPAKSVLKVGRKNLRRPNPVAIPNLTKKARGRPVPTKDTLLKPGSGRAYACPVDDCRKVFTRSEHLKRHTRSIHTNEKREHPSHINGCRVMSMRY